MTCAAPAKNRLKAATSQMVDASASVKTVRRAFSENLHSKALRWRAYRRQAPLFAYIHEHKTSP